MPDTVLLASDGAPSMVPGSGFLSSDPLSSSLRRLVGVDSFTSLRVVPDLDGDGSDELAIATKRGGEDLFVLFGPVLGDVVVSDQAETHRISGAEELTTLGRSVAVGNVNGDELPDLVVGSASAASGRGAVFVYPGSLP